MEGRQGISFMSRSDHSVIPESFDGIARYWLDSQSPLNWDCLFVLPPWLKVWWQEFGSDADLYLSAVNHNGETIGIAPLQIRGEEASFIGSKDVCDYLDFIVTPARERDFFDLLLDDLGRKGIRRLDLGPVRPDSSVAAHLIPVARSRGCEVSCSAEDVTLEVDLPSAWDEYLGRLNQKQRHEVRRKLRRLEEAGAIRYYTIEESESVPGGTEIFLKLFRESRKDKAVFMSAPMESFFASLTKAMAGAGLLRFGILELNHSPVAAAMCFDYRDVVYLYNNGYDPQYGPLSVGSISKVLSIKESIERGRKKFDFLKGDEEYKQRLGGEEITLSGCRITLK
jgi:CelD/BcsL family acetyltransferase involved in cellulose biosynthesis